MKRLIFSIIIFLCFIGVSQAATHTVTTCSVPNVQAAITAAVAGDDIYLNCASATWASAVTVNKGVHIYGNGSTSTTITAGGSSIFVINAAGGNYRISNMAFRGTTGSDIKVNGAWTTMRFDNINWQTGSARAFWIGEMITADVLYSGLSRPHAKILIHDITYAPTASGAGRPFALIHGRGHLAWQEPDGFGTDNFVFIEDCTFNYTSYPGGYITDTERGGRFVLRYNTILNAGAYMHDLGSTPYARGNRAVEVYENTMTCNVGTAACSSIYGLNAVRGGTGVFYNNTLTGYSTYTWPMIFRVAYNTSFVGGGYCSQTGTRKVCQDVAKHCSGGSRDKRPCWDSSNCPGGTCGGYTCSANSDCLDAYGNTGLCMQIDGLGRTGSEVAGWPCRDQMGRGQDNSTTGAQTSSPVYWWNNTINGTVRSLSVGSQYTDYIIANRDYYNSAKPGYTAYQYPHPWRSGEEPPEDTTPPVITGESPSGTIVYSASQTITVTTNENSVCAICEDPETGCDADSSYYEVLAAGSLFSTTGGTNHSIAKDVAAETAYTYYASCRDTSTNQNAMDGITSGEEPEAISFTTGTAEGGDSTPPVLSNVLPSGTVYPCGSNVTLQVTATDDSGTVSGCKYCANGVGGCASSTAYADMAGTFDAPGGTGGIATDDSYAASNYADNGFFISASYATTLGQSFESGGGTLDNVRFYLRKNGTPTGNMTATIHAISGAYGGGDDVGTGAALATSDTVSIAGLTTSVTLTTFTFSGANRITLVDGTQYVVSVNYSGGDETNRLHIGRDNTTPSHTGNAAYTSGEAWTAVSGSDLIFYVYVDQGSAGDFTDTLTSPTCGQSYTYFYRCTDGTNPNTSSETATFTIAGGACPIAGCVEFEAGTNAAPMIEYTDAAASGGQYVATTTREQGTSTHSVVVATAGTYRIVARVHAIDDGYDSVYLTIDAEDTVLLGLNHSMSTANWNVWREETLNYLT